jgi:CYTH domain-containing protein
MSDDAAWVAIKGEPNGITRPEFEYDVPVTDAEQIKDLCLQPILEKTRFTIQWNGLTWEVDEYEGDNKGLVVAEVETDSEKPIPRLPGWVGEDISSDERYRNINLVQKPFSQWSDKAKPKTTFNLIENEAVGDGVRRMLDEQLSLAIYELSNTGDSLDTAVHEARKCIKKARSLLRLVRPAAPKLYSRENRRLQVIGRSLSELRDSQALIDTLHDLKESGHTKEPGNSGASYRFESVHELLRARKQNVADSLQDKGHLQTAINQLTEVRDTIAHASLRNVDFQSIVRQLASAIKRGKHSFNIAYADPTPENFHEFRKRAKDFRYQLGVLTKLWPDVFDAYVSSAKELEQMLGDDHNLAVLTDVVNDDKSHGGNKQALHKKIRKKQALLREKARSLGSRIYSESAKTWTRRLEASWNAWTEVNRD